MLNVLCQSREGLRRRVSGKFIFVAFLALVIINIVVLVAYTTYSSKEERLAGSDELITKLANTLYLLDNSPEKDWPTIARVSQTSELAVSISPAPLWSLQIIERGIDHLSDVLAKIPDDLAVSIRLDDDSWLNIQFTPVSDARVLQITIISLGVVVALALLFSAWTLVRFTVPLREFKRAADKLGVELRVQPMIEYGPAVVRETADAMNQMQQRILKLLQDRNRMLAAISHDLRTPITRLKLRSQFIQDKEHYQDMSDDLDEMEQMIDQILTYTREASNVGQLVDLELVALLLSICDEKCEQGFSVECHTNVPRVKLKGNALALKRAFTNLVNNAVKYAKHVVVTINQQGDDIIITLEDDGPGIPDDHMAKVFSPFYRIDSSRNSKTGGAGLGLAIAQDVICAHHGSIQLKNRPEGGLLVQVNLSCHWQQRK